eukprot:6363813-Prorocentrum_lima.AAC.1
MRARERRWARSCTRGEEAGLGPARVVALREKKRVGAPSSPAGAPAAANCCGGGGPGGDGSSGAGPGGAEGGGTPSARRAGMVAATA